MSFKLTIKASDDDARALLNQLQGNQPRILFYRATINNLTVIEGDITMLILTNSQQVDLAIKPLDKRGKPAQVDGVPVWACSDPLLATVEPSEDGLSCVVKALDNGSAQISVSADADLGEGVRALTGTLDLEIVSGEAASLSIIAGTPQEQVL